jgi:hypothetical protein
MTNAEFCMVPGIEVLFGEHKQRGRPPVRSG